MFRTGPFTRAQAQALKAKVRDPNFNPSELINFLQDIISYYYVLFQGLKHAHPSINKILDDELIPLYDALLEILGYYIDTVTNKQDEIQQLTHTVDHTYEIHALNRTRIAELLTHISELEPNVRDITDSAGDPVLLHKLDSLIAEKQELYKIIENLRKQPPTRNSTTQTMFQQGSSSALGPTGGQQQAGTSSDPNFTIATANSNSAEKLEFINSVPTFCTEGNPTPIDEFFNIVEIFAKVGNWSDETAIAVAKTKIAGSTGVSIRSEEPFRTLTSWKQFRSTVSKRFAPVELFTTKNLQFVTCCQHQNESAQNFAARLSSVASKLVTRSPDPYEAEIRKKLIEEQKLLYFVQGLQPALKVYVQLSNPTSFEEAVESASKYEPNITSPSMPFSQPVVAPIHTVSATDSHIEAVVTKLLTKMHIGAPANQISQTYPQEQIDTFTKTPPDVQKYTNHRNAPHQRAQNYSQNFPNENQHFSNQNFSNQNQPNNRSRYNNNRNNNSRQFGNNNKNWVPNRPQITAQFTQNDLMQVAQYMGQMFLQNFRQPNHQTNNFGPGRDFRTGANRNIQCYNCRKFGHVARECRSPRTRSTGQNLPAIEWPRQSTGNEANKSN